VLEKTVSSMIVNTAFRCHWSLVDSGRLIRASCCWWRGMCN